MSESATATISSVQLSAGEFQYTIDLTNTGTDPIGTFWFAWIPGQGYLPDLPAPAAPSGWEVHITNGAPPHDGYSIQWIAGTNAALAPGQSLDTFTFTSATPPSVIAGNSAIHSPTPILTTTIYQGGPFVGLADTIVVSDASCFAQGTRILTEAGECRVEALRPGMRLATLSGEFRELIWLGHRQVDCRRHPKPENVWPVRVAAHAFGEGLPHRDLYLSPDHAIFTWGVLVPVKYLINGTTVVQQPHDQIIYFHVELEAHDIVLAEALPCETYLNTGNRHAFANATSVTSLHADFAPGADAAAVWEASACAPLHASGEPVGKIAAQLRQQAEILGYAPAPLQAAAPAAAPATDLATLLDPAWYRAAHPDVAAAKYEPAQHYAAFGRREGRRPCPEISLIRGLAMLDPASIAVGMGDVVQAGFDPVEHFCGVGWREGRNPNPYFNTAWYLRTHKPPAEMNPLLHYLLIGEPAGLAPSPHFAPAWYREQYALKATQSPLAHYLQHRGSARFAPNPNFDVAIYRAAHAATLRPGRDPYAHYLAFRQPIIVQVAA